MKVIITILSCLICVQLLACCNKTSDITPNIKEGSMMDSVKLKVVVGTNTFTAILYNNATVTAFKSRLPMTLHMSELNGNEKYFDLSDNLPVNATTGGNIQAGDLRLYGSNTLVLFYKTFSTSYKYTPLGRIENVSGLAAALGPGDLTIMFALQ